MNGGEDGRPGEDFAAPDPIKENARRRAVGAVICGIVILVVAALAYAGWSADVAVRAVALGATVIGVLTLLAAGFARSIGRHHPDVRTLSGPNLLVGAIGAAIALVCAVLCVVDGSQLGLVLGGLMLVLGVQLLVYVRANHRDVRSASGSSTG